MRRPLKPLAIAVLATAALLAAPGASSSVAAGDVRTLATVNGLSAGLSARPGVLVYAGIRDSGESVPSDPDDFTDLFTVRADGSGFRRLTRTTVWEDDPAWAPNRRLIAYSRATPFCHANTCGWDPGEASIWLMAADGRGRRPLTSGEEDDFIDKHPAWSPDGSRVAFTRESLDAGGSRSGIFVIGVDGEGLARLTLERAISLAWSPDGKTIAYVHRRGHVGLLDVASRRSRRLPVRGLEAPSAVDWSPRGRFLAIADRDELQLVRAGGERVRKLVEGRSPEQVSWSPDGCCLAFSAERKGERSGQLDLYLVSVRGGRARRLTASPGYDLDPDWRP